MTKLCPCCVSWKNAALTSCITSLVVCTGLLTTAITSVITGGDLSPFVVASFSIIAVPNFVSSFYCLRGVYTENSNYLLPWLVTVSISAIYAFVTSVYYMVYEVNRKAPFGIAVFILTLPSILGVICVINHYYQLEGSGHKKHQKTATTGVNTEISSASLPSDMVDEHNGAPPPYTSIFVNSETQLKGCANDREKQPEYYRGIYVGEDTTVGAAGSDDKRRF